MLLLIRSLIFNASMYLAMGVLAIAFAPFALFSQSAAFMAAKLYCRYVIWTAGWMVGLKSEVRGTPPTGEVLIAAKHQSFLDIILIFNSVPRGRFIMKHILLYAPLFGQYAWRMGCVPVHRGRRGAAIEKMLKDVKKGRQDPGQLIIYPQGTRVAPGISAPFKSGTAALYHQLDQPCVPAATNVGVFWPRHGFLRKPGLAVVEFLPEIPAGLGRTEFMDQLATEVEEGSNRLMAEAGFILMQQAADAED